MGNNSPKPTEIRMNASLLKMGNSLSSDDKASNIYKLKRIKEVKKNMPNTLFLVMAITIIKASSEMATGLRITELENQ